jgi:hypothetical protein
MIAMSQPWDVRVDFNTYPGPDLVYGNALHSGPASRSRPSGSARLGGDRLDAGPRLCPGMTSPTPPGGRVVD